MDGIKNYINKITDNFQRERFESLLDWTQNTYPEFKLEYKWNQPMFIYKGIFMISYTISKKHISVAPEGYVMDLFRESISQVGYDHSLKIFRITWKQEVNYALLKSIIDFKLEDRQGETNFWK